MEQSYKQQYHQLRFLVWAGLRADMKAMARYEGAVRTSVCAKSDTPTSEICVARDKMQPRPAHEYLQYLFIPEATTVTTPI